MFTIKVYEANVQSQNRWTRYKTDPQIRLQGQWLEKLGFETGDEIDISCGTGKIIIRNYHNKK